MEIAKLMHLKIKPLGIVLIISILISYSIITFNPWFVLTVILGVVVSLLALANPNRALLAIVLYIPLEGIFVSALPEQYFDYARTVPEAILFVVFIASLKSKTRFKVCFSDMILVLLLMWSVLISLINNIEFIYFLSGGRVLFRFLMVYMIVRRLNEPLIFFNKAYIMLVRLVIAQCVLGFLQAAGKLLQVTAYWNNFGNNEAMKSVFYGVQGTLLRYDQFGMFLAIIGVLIFCKYLNGGYRSTLFPFLFLIPAILLSTSRQAMVFLALGVLIAFIISKGRGYALKKMRIIFFLIVLLIPILLIPSWTNGEGRSPLKQVSTLFKSETYSTGVEDNFRLYFITNVGSLLIKKNFLGMGLGTFGSIQSVENMKTVYAEYQITNSFFLKFIADVNWISILGQIGVFGTFILLLYFFTHISILKNRLKEATDEEKAILVASIALTICFLLAGLFGPNYEIRTNSFMLWLVNGLAIKIVSK